MPRQPSDNGGAGAYDLMVDHGYVPVRPERRCVLVHRGEGSPRPWRRILLDPSVTKAVLVDMDGTLVDSGWVWRQVLRDFLGERGIAWDDGSVEALFAGGLIAGIPHMRESLGLPDTSDEILHEWQVASTRLYAEAVMPFAGAFEAVLRIREAGIPVALVTMNSLEAVSALAERFDLPKMFDTIVTKEKGMSGKDKKEVFITGCARLRVTSRPGGEPEPRNVVVIEDSPLALSTARAEGFTTIGHLVGDKPLEGGVNNRGLTVAGTSHVTFSDWETIGTVSA